MIRSPLRGRYLVRNPLLLLAVAGVDLLLALAGPRARPPVPAIRRLLIGMGGHLGDGVLLTAVLRYVRAVRPDIEIGVALPSWAKVTIERDPRVKWIHTVDHWKESRSAESFWAKWRRYRASRGAAIEAMRQVHYDAAVDLRAHYPNMATLLERASIPARVGFTSAGFGRLYTHPVDWRDDHTHIVARHIELLQQVLGTNAAPTSARCELPMGDERTIAVTASLLATHELGRGEYFLVHMGSGARERNWSETEWRGVCQALAARGQRVVFTGRGDDERAMIAALAPSVPGSVDLSNQLQWAEFVEVIRGARCVLTVETSAAHVAAATDTPCVTVWLGRRSAPYWRPLGSRITVLVPQSQGATCDCPAGCAEITCVPRVSADAVLHAAEELLQNSPGEIPVTTPVPIGTR